MELCIARSNFNLPLHHPKPIPVQSHLHCRIQLPFLHNQARFSSEFRFYRNLPVKCAASDETPTDRTRYVENDLGFDGGVTAEDKLPVEKNEDSDKKPEISFAELIEEPLEGSFVDNFQLSKFLEDLDIKLDLEDTPSILLLGGGAFVALWLAASVVSAIDSIPVLPKLLELVGLGYTIWFATRYLIFKENRDELVDKVEQIKKEVLGTKFD